MVEMITLQKGVNLFFYHYTNFVLVVSPGKRNRNVGRVGQTKASIKMWLKQQLKLLNPKPCFLTPLGNYFPFNQKCAIISCSHATLVFSGYGNTQAHPIPINSREQNKYRQESKFKTYLSSIQIQCSYSLHGLDLTRF